MPMDLSTRVSIVEHSLDDIQARLAELPDSPITRELVARALEFEQIIASWAVVPPMEEERQEVLRRILDLNVDIIHFAAEKGRYAPTATPLEEADEDFPRSVGNPGSKR
jgi:hypothetical protein